jgi:DNA polymerase-4
VTSAPSILHVDIDAFYASVEQLDDPSIRDRPVIVGGLGPRGVVAAASYEARRFGVHSALPMARARRACPDGVFLAPRFERYGEKSRDVMEILRTFTPLVEPIASDEAFLDVSGAARLYGPGPDCAVAIRHRVREETGLAASVGVATTKLLAKLASETAKPDGLFVVEVGTELDFLHPLPVERLWGVGPATRRRLAALGVRTIGELARQPEEAVISAIGNAHGRHLHSLAWNRDGRPVDPEREMKSVSSEATFATDLTDRARLEREIAHLADGVGARVRAAGRVGRTVQLKVRYADFRTVTRSRTLREPTDRTSEIGAVAKALLAAVPDLDRGVRLLGVGLQQLLVPEPVQQDLFADATAPAGTSRPADTEAGDRDALERTVDAVHARFGTGALGPAAARVEGASPVRENGDA